MIETIQIINLKSFEKKIDSDVINNEVISRFKRAFETKEQYFVHLTAIWTLRDLVGSRIYDGISHESPEFLMFKTLNEITCILIANKELFLEFNSKYRV